MELLQDVIVTLRININIVEKGILWNIIDKMVIWNLIIATNED